MRKTIYLVRHATAESPAPMFRDFQRELTSSGYIEAAKMGAFLRSLSCQVGRIAASSAFRTRQTAQVFAEQLGFDWDKADLIDDLYDCGARAYIKTVTETSEEVSQLMIVGHNPDISYFAEYLAAGFTGNMEKSSVCILEFEGLSWEEITNRSGIFQRYIAPAELPK